MALQSQTITRSRLPNLDVSTDRYEVRFAQTQKDIDSALRLRYEVFNLELGNEQPSSDLDGLEFDKFDYQCRHLIVIDRKTRRTVGTYRLNSIDAASKVDDFYSFSEFSIEDLPKDVLINAVEIGRACISYDHRNTRVLFLLWKGLAAFIKETDNQFLFGCCSIFTTDCEVGTDAYEHLKRGKFLHKELKVRPRKEKACRLTIGRKNRRSVDLELPSLFNMYLKIGAKICGKPVVDHAFGTIDFFVIFDVQTLNERYRRIFFGDFQTTVSSTSSNLKSLSTETTVEQRVP